MCSQPTESSVLYQNPARFVTLLDLPTSIRVSSGVQNLSTFAPVRPYPGNEPKDSKREHFLISIPQDEQDYHNTLQKLIIEALTEIREHYMQPKWCLDRLDTIGPTHILHQSDDSVVAETLERDDRIVRKDAGLRSDSKTFIQRKSSPTNPTGGVILARTVAHTQSPPLILSSLGNRISSVDVLRNVIVTNGNTGVVKMTAPEGTLLIPAQSTFLLSSIRHGLRCFSAAVQVIEIRPETPSTVFDFILLDPPWPNRSVRNAKTYNTSERQSQEHPFVQAIPVIRGNLASSGITAIWITNKRAVRDIAIRLMADLCLELYEEWIWIKTTTLGEPVTALSGLWRKPYEILLLFRYCKTKILEPDQVLLYPNVNRRVIVAVPDAHSRKPCLKELLGPLLPSKHLVLEIFARNLTTGWWSWGDEVLKFNQAIPSQSSNRKAR